MAARALIVYPQMFTTNADRSRQARYPLTQGVNPWLVTVSVMLPPLWRCLTPPLPR